MAVVQAFWSHGDAALGRAAEWADSVGGSSAGRCPVKQVKKEIQVTMPDSVTTIGRDACRGCKKLRRVAIPGCITVIGERRLLRLQLFE